MAADDRVFKELSRGSSPHAQNERHTEIKIRVGLGPHLAFAPGTRFSSTQSSRGPLSMREKNRLRPSGLSCGETIRPLMDRPMGSSGPPATGTRQREDVRSV